MRSRLHTRGERPGKKVLGGPGAKTSAMSGRGSAWVDWRTKPVKMAEMTGGCRTRRSKSTRSSKYSAARK